MTDWPVKTLGDVCEVIAGQSPEGKFYNKEGKGVPFYQGKKDFAERVLGSPTTWTAEVTKLARPGDILMSVRAPVGPVNLCPIEACIGRGLAAIRPSSKTDTDFIYYYLESIQSEIAGTEGAVFASINKAQIEGLRCPVPPLEEQKRIVALLDAATARVTELTACYEQARTRASNLFTSALRFALEGNLSWPIKALDDFCDIYQPQTIGLKDLIVGGQYVVYGANGPIGFYDRFNHENSEVTVTCRGATCGTVNVTPPQVWITGNAMVIRPSETEMTKQMIRYVLEGLDYSSVITGAAQPQITRQTLAPSKITVPPLEEQKRIVAHLDSMREKTSQMVAAYDAKLTAATNLRQSILVAAFAGEL
jgi:type I restriction enzyme S subunit